MVCGAQGSGKSRSAVEQRGLSVGRYIALVILRDEVLYWDGCIVGRFPVRVLETIYPTSGVRSRKLGGVGLLALRFFDI
jgi:hypothetical protein